MVPVRLVHFSYFVASAYVVTHSVSRSTVAKNRSSQGSSSLDGILRQRASSCKERRSQSVLSPSRAFVDTLIWQGLASVIIPGLVINRTCALSRLLLNQVFRRQLSEGVRKWVVTGVGLGTIPVIIHPIDRLVGQPKKIGALPLSLWCSFTPTQRMLLRPLLEVQHHSAKSFHQ